MAEEDKKPDEGLDLSTAALVRAARELGSPGLDSRLSADGRPEGRKYDLISPMTAAFNRLGERNAGLLPQTLPFMGTSPISYTSYRGSDGVMHQDGKRGIEYQVPDTNLRLMAGSYLPGHRTEGVENWTAGVAWTPVNLGGLKIGPMLGDVAQSDMRGGSNKPFERLGLSVGLYATAETREGGIFGKIETDPAHNNKPRIFIGVKMPFNGQ